MSSSAGDVLTLLDALDAHTGVFGADDPRTLAVVHELAMALWGAGDKDGALGLLEQVLHRTTSHLGAHHPSSLAAKGDLAAVLFELGEEEQAEGLEREALESARSYLGKTHSVTCVLAWNRALNYERCGDPDAARKVLAEELAWLLAEDPSSLETDQNIVRTLLVERFHWDAAKAC